MYICSNTCKYIHTYICNIISRLTYFLIAALNNSYIAQYTVTVPASEAAESWDVIWRLAG